MRNNTIAVNKPIILQLKDVLANEGFCFAESIELGRDPGKSLSGMKASRGCYREVFAVCNMEKSGGIFDFLILCNNIVRKERNPSTLFLTQKIWRKVLGGLVLTMDRECVFNIHGQENFTTGESLAKRILPILNCTLSVNVYDNDLGWECNPK